MYFMVVYKTCTVGNYNKKYLEIYLYTLKSFWSFFNFKSY